jgi:Flp pilus assembly protein TadG
MTSRISNERGAAIIETAITLPLMLLVVVGIFEFGRAFQTWEVLTNAAREGARVAVLPSGTNGDAETRVRDYLTSGQIAHPADANIAVNRNVAISIGGTNATASRVTVNYPFEFMVLQPVANLVVNGTTTGEPITMSAVSEMRNEAP